jgi:AdoMet-dependent heme synthase
MDAVVLNAPTLRLCCEERSIAMDLNWKLADTLGQHPRLVIWETLPARDTADWYPREATGTQLAALPLSFAEGCDLIDQVAGLGTPRPSLLLTGDDPLQRSDLCDLVRYATRQELPVALSLSGTPLLTAARLRRLKDAGASAITLALDGATPELHDHLQGMAGSFAQTIAGTRAAHASGLPPTIVSTVTCTNLLDLPDLLALVHDLGVTTWHVAFPNPNDWAHAEDAIAPPDYEAVLNLLYDVRRFVRVTTNASRHFRRVTLQLMVLEAWNLPAEQYMRLNATYRRLKARLHAVTWDQGRPPPAGYVQHTPPLGCVPGSCLFVTHQGDVFPDGDRGHRAGNVRETTLVDIYNQSPAFRMPLDRPILPARCNRCEFRWMCGAGQAWLNTLTGGSWDEPLCAYEPGTFPFVSDVLALVGIT